MKLLSALAGLLLLVLGAGQAAAFFTLDGHERWYYGRSDMMPFAPNVDGAIVIGSSPGGRVGQTLLHIDFLRGAGTQVRIEGECMSACTLVLSLPPCQRSYSSRSVWMFHAARTSEGRIDHLVTAVMLERYPARVREFIGARLHFPEADAEVVLYGDELARLDDKCAP